jgi:hypothetical protein
MMTFRRFDFATLPPSSICAIAAILGDASRLRKAAVAGRTVASGDAIRAR